MALQQYHDPKRSSALSTMSSNDEPALKRPRYELTPALQAALIARPDLSHKKTRLEAPNIRLWGHTGEVLGCCFSPDGASLASSSFDPKILLWHVYPHENNEDTEYQTSHNQSQWDSNNNTHNSTNYGVLSGHTNAVLDLDFSIDGQHLYSCSADKTCAIWDVEYGGQRIKSLKGHVVGVNSIKGAKNIAAKGGGDKNLIVSGADDGCTKIWDGRVRRCVGGFDHTYQVLSVCFDYSCDKVFSGCLDDTIRCFDLRMIGKEEDPELYVLEGDETGLKGHNHAVTGIALSPDGEKLVSTSMDQTVKLWDVRSYIGSDHLTDNHNDVSNSNYNTNNNTNQNLLKRDSQARCLASFDNCIKHNFEKNLLRVAFSNDGEYIGAGSADKNLYIWHTESQQLTYKLPGHEGSVNCVAFSPVEDIVCSGSSDKSLFVGELGD